MQIAWRRRWVILLCHLTCLAGALAYLFVAAPLYRSTSRLYVEAQDPRLLGSPEAVGQGANYLRTQAELLRSTTVLGEAVQRLPVLEMQSLRGVDNPVACLKRELDIEVGKDNDLITVGFESRYPQQSAQIVNAVVEAYMDFHGQKKKSTAAEVLRVLQRERQKRDAELAMRFKAMVDYKAAKEDLALEGKEGNLASERLEKLSQDLTEAKVAALESQGALEAAKAMAASPPKLELFMATTGTVAAGAVLGEGATRLLDQINRMESDLTRLKLVNGDDHPLVRQLEQTLESLKLRAGSLPRQSAEALLSVAKQRCDMAQAKVRELERVYESERNGALALNTQRAKLSILQWEYDQAKRVIELLDDRIRQIKVDEDAGPLNIAVVEVAKAESTPVKPRKLLVTAVGALFGLFIGVGLALVLELRDDRLGEVEQIRLALRLPVLGLVPEMPSGLDVPARANLVRAAPQSPVAEAYRTIRTAIYFALPKDSAKTILITSAVLGEGKSTLVSNLGLAMAQSGRRTIVVDADCRAPSQDRHFGLAKEPGLADVLSGRVPWQDAIHPTQDGPDVMPCGRLPANPSELLDSDSFLGLIQELAERYDKILIDSPPVLPVADPRILAASCDVTLLVLRAGRSTRRATVHAIQALEGVGAKLAGIVITGASPQGDKYGYGSYYGYGRTRDDSPMPGSGAEPRRNGKYAQPAAA